MNLKKDKLINKSKVKTNIGPLYRPNLWYLDLSDTNLIPTTTHYVQIFIIRDCLGTWVGPIQKEDDTLFTFIKSNLFILYYGYW